MNALNLINSFMLEVGRNVSKRAKVYDSNHRLDGQIAVITGANTSTGKFTAEELARRGVKVIMACRSLDKGRQAISDITSRNVQGDLLILMQLDLSSLKSVREFAAQVGQRVPRVDILVNNAGVMNKPESSTLDGFEMHIGVNHLGHFLLTMLLMPLLLRSPNARIIQVSSVVHAMGKINLDNLHLHNGAYSRPKAFAQSKLANVLFVRELAHRLGPDSNVRTYSVHPGAHMTDQIISNTNSMGYKMTAKLLMESKMAAQTIIYCSVNPGLDNESGFYYENCGRNDHMVPEATDDKMAAKLWELSSNLVHLEPHLRLAPLFI